MTAENGNSTPPPTPPFGAEEGYEADAGAADHKRMLEALDRLRAERDARRALEYEEMAPTRALRVKRTAEEFSALPQAPVVMEDTLAAEVNLLAGPGAAGKSLLARDWALCVASGSRWRGHGVPESRSVLWVASEGTHDFYERWGTQPLWDDAKDRVWVLDAPVNLTSAEDVGWLLEEYRVQRPGLVVFDIIYGMGLPDDNGSKDILPLLNNMKRISKAWSAATLALGHPGHNGERRFRGSSMWRQLAYTEWHLAEGRLTCEKSKIARAEAQGALYVAEYPHLRWLGSGEALARSAKNDLLIAADIAAHPDDSDRARSIRLAVPLGVSTERARKLIRAHRKSTKEDPK